MSHLDELCGDSTIAPDARVANIARHGNPPNPPTSPMSQEVRL
jgi:hypothetical protein